MNFSFKSDYWLRWATPKGILLPTAMELATIERKLKTAERKRADNERKRADKLAELLKKHGIKPDA